MRRLAGLVGVENGTQLKRLVGCSNETAYGIWEGTLTMVKFETLARLGVALGVADPRVLLSVKVYRGRQSKFNGLKRRRAA